MGLYKVTVPPGCPIRKEESPDKERLDAPSQPTDCEAGMVKLAVETGAEKTGPPFALSVKVAGDKSREPVEPVWKAPFSNITVPPSVAVPRSNSSEPDF